jgi:xanthine dehydrogenase YagS FAD-binding subunit
MIAFEYIRSASLEAAVASKSKNNGAALIAGGTNLVDLMKRGVTAPEKLIDISSLPLDTIEQKKDSVIIGAMVRNSVAAEHPIILGNYPLLSLAIKAGASQQIRNMASTGGNLLQRTRCPYFYDTVTPCNKREPGSGCSALKGYNRMHAIFGTTDNCIAVHPSDMCVALAALNASVVVQNAKGSRMIPFTDFHRLPGNEPQKDTVLEAGDIITGVQIPANGFQKHVSYLKIRDRSSYAFALVSVAAALDIKGGVIQEARLAMGGVAHKPWRLTEAEHLLKGMHANEVSFNKAATIAMHGAKGYGFNNFKLKMAPKAIVQSLKQAAGLV